MSSFTFSARTILELGKELISSDEVALYELIKNAVDAGSPAIRINAHVMLSRVDYQRALDLLSGDALMPDRRQANISQVLDHIESSVPIGYGRGAEQVVEAILHDAEEPLHYSEIARLAATRAGREIDERRVHNAAAEVGLLFGPGTYGLIKHVNVSPDDLEAMADEASEVVFEGPTERQWHTSELLDAIQERGSRGSVAGKHILDIALKRQGQLRSLGRMVWMAPGGDVDALRVEVRQAQIAILQQAGRPLTTAELRQRLVAVRGLNENMQLSLADPIIKLDSSLWGLNDRDVIIKREAQPQFLDSVHDLLTNAGRSVHIIEFSDLLSAQISSRALISLIQTDRRFRTDSKQNVSLR